MTFELHQNSLQSYLSSLFGAPVRVIAFGPLGAPVETGEVKGYGYGAPIQIDYEVFGKQHRAVLETMKPGSFGHEHMADRAQVQLWNHHAFKQLPRHARSLDVGAFQKEGTLLSLGEAKELFTLMAFYEGRGYFEDLERLRDYPELSELDLNRADVLCDYLVEIHKSPGPAPGLYIRHLRELVGHGECIMGLIDSYPARHGFITSVLLEEIEQKCVAWRWRLKGKTARLRQSHGDFHPWNILFRNGADFTVLDRSRGEWGDPADDVCCLTMNYLFFSLQRGERLDGNLETLFLRFWARYLEKSGDAGILEVAAPYFAFRGLVMASPIWYPHLSEGVRLKLFNFIQSVLDQPRFDPEKVNQYCDG
ncbi:MAG: phosphotransferase family protein [Nitrospiria bacterium]